MNTNTIRRKAEEAFAATTGTLDTLFSRWLDEHDFEDIADYADAFGKALPDGCRVTKATKRPFGFVVEIEGTRFHFKATTRSLSLEELLTPERTA